MKSFEQIAAAMYTAYWKRDAQLYPDAHGVTGTWEQLPQTQRECWIAAAKQAVAEMATVH